MLPISCPDPSILNDLERRLDAAERKYQEADLETKLKALEEAKQRQVKYSFLASSNFIITKLKFQLQRKTVLKNEYDLVKGEFDTIESILDELPDFCPNGYEYGIEI